MYELNHHLLREFSNHLIYKMNDIHSSDLHSSIMKNMTHTLTLFSFFLIQLEEEFDHFGCTTDHRRDIDKKIFFFISRVKKSSNFFFGGDNLQNKEKNSLLIEHFQYETF